MDRLQEGQLVRGHRPSLAGVVDDRSDQAAPVSNRHPDQRPAPTLEARALTGLEGHLFHRPWMQDTRAGVAVPLGEDGLRDPMTTHVLEHPVVDAHGVVPVLPVQHLEPDPVVSEEGVQLGVQDLDQPCLRVAGGEEPEQA